jgi:glycosyltransferase involved in cell wall biosynthesis
MKKILFIVTSSEIGGAQRFVQEQIDILHESNYDCFLVTNNRGWLSKKVENKLINYFYSTLINGFSFKFIFNLCLFIQRNKIELIVCNSANGGFYGRICGFIMRVKSIYVSHGWSSIYNGGNISFFYNKIEYLLSIITTNIICISNSDYDKAVNLIGINKKKITILPNTILSLNQNNIIHETKKNIKVLTVCRLKHPKRVDLLISAFSKFPDLRLSIIGDGPNKNTLLNLVNSFKLSNISFLGNIDEFKEFKEYDLFVLISESEGLPISALEAMSSGLALVLSNVGGCPELINNNGVLVNNTIEDIIGGLSYCLENIEEFKINSLNLFNMKFNLELNKKRYLDYYNNIL